MWQAVVIVTALSVLVQAAAVVLALRLIRVTGKRSAWLLIAVGIAGMAARRLASLAHFVIGVDDARPDAFALFYETLGLVTSILVLAGIARIGPIFRAAQDAADAQGRLVARLQEAAATVKTLSGLLPICASCKKIRDDRGYWNQIETYIRDRSDAEFTHGLCPECSKRYLADRDD